jgi:hypothetical protein
MQKHLRHDVGLLQPPDLSLADDVHCFIACDRVQCAVHGSELTGHDALLHVPMVLLEDVVHVLRQTASATTAQRSGLFQVCHRRSLSTGRVPQYPASDGRVINRQATLGHHVLEIAIAERVPQIPAQAQDDDLVVEMSAAKQRLVGFRPSAFTLPDKL